LRNRLIGPVKQRHVGQIEHKVPILIKLLTGLVRFRHVRVLVLIDELIQDASSVVESSNEEFYDLWILPKKLFNIRVAELICLELAH